MTITTLIGLTPAEIDRAHAEMDYEYFQLEEITRHYAERMRRRDQKRNIIRALAFATPVTDFEKYQRRWAKLRELDKHAERDSKRWHAGMDRRIALHTRWNAMWDELQAAEATA